MCDDAVTMTRYENFETAGEVTKFVLGLEVTNAMRAAENKGREYEVLSVTEVGPEMLANFKPHEVMIMRGVEERKEHLRKLAEQEKRKAADEGEAERQRLLGRQRSEYARFKAKFEKGDDICVCHGSGTVIRFRTDDGRCSECGCLIPKKCPKCSGYGRHMTFGGRMEVCSECKGTGEAK